MQSNNSSIPLPFCIDILNGTVQNVTISETLKLEYSIRAVSNFNVAMHAGASYVAASERDPAHDCIDCAHGQSVDVTVND